jgi:hypothetical protein
MWRWLILSRPCIFSGLCLTNCLKICSKKLWINTRFSSCFLLLWSGLPDGLFSNQKSKFGYILEGLALKDVGIFNRHLVAFTVFRYILWTFGIVRGNLAYFFPFWYFVPRKIWQPWLIGCLCNFPISLDRMTTTSTSTTWRDASKHSRRRSDKPARSCLRAKFLVQRKSTDKFGGLAGLHTHILDCHAFLET